jgi:predicted negative regulator of RcsB-dependent stress response
MAKKKKKRVTRKELLKKPDEFITFTAKAFRFAAAYKNQLTGLLIGLIILSLIVAGMRYFSNKAENTAFERLSQSQTKYEALLKEMNPQKALAEVASDFEAILSNYPTKSGGKLARVIYANMCYKAGRLDEAIALYKESLKDFNAQPFLKNLILSGLGYAYEDKKDFESATRYFDMIVAESDSILKGDALFNLGRLHAVSGHRDQSIQAYKQLLADPLNSIYIELVKEKLGSY